VFREVFRALERKFDAMTGKNRELLLDIMKNWVRESGVGLSGSVLILGGSADDEETLRCIGFENITLSGFDNSDADRQSEKTEGSELALDAENIALEDNKFDFIFIHEALHHCRSPHRALCEILRVSKQHVVFMEPNDSLFVTGLIKFGLSFPFEVPAVIANGFVSGGVRDSQIPNFIYRWNAHEVEKLVSSFMPEWSFKVFAYPYWCFNVDERELALRTQTKIGKITKLLGVNNFLQFLKVAQLILNSVSIFREQGNKFFCHIEVSDRLQPWLCSSNGRIEFNRDFIAKD
jgi:SAM-dependent methyltransferase